MKPVTLRHLAELAGGVLAGVSDPDVVVTGPVVADSRQVGPGSVFVALRGERVDGHAFAADAAAAGAGAVLADRPCGAPAVVVDDVPGALARLARGSLALLPDVTVVGVTGSSGKTSTKDLLAHLLGKLGPTVAPPESYNNEIGHPLTVLRARESTRHLVLELSARGQGHIAHLTGIAPPRIGAVLNVGTAHLGEFGSREAIARAKGELVEALPADGVAVLNADDPLVSGMASRTRARTITFGTSAAATVRAEHVHLDRVGRATFTLRTPEGSATVALRTHGAHQVGNALAGAAVARGLGMPVTEVAAGLGEAHAVSRWRMDVRECAGDLTVINDAYNANPDSTAAALRALATIAAGRRAWAVLGEMAELGDASAEAHRDIGALAARLGVARVIAVEPAAEPIARGASQAGAEPADSGDSGVTAATAVADNDAAIAVLREQAEPGDVILVKGSRSAAMERVADAVTALSDQRGGAGEVRR